MFTFYTLLFLVLTYLSYSLIVAGVSSYCSLIRGFYYVYLFFLWLYNKLLKNKMHIKISGFSVILSLCVLLAFPYIFISQFFGKAIVTFFLYFSGPVLFLMISSLSFKEKTIQKFDLYLFIVMCFLFILNFIFYFYQDSFINYYEQTGLIDFKRNDKTRFLGIALHPTFTGFFFIFFISYLLIKKRKIIISIISSVFFFLTGTRSAMVGIPFYFFFKSKKILKVILFTVGIVSLCVIYYLFTKGSLAEQLLKYEPSAWRHLYDLFVTGPGVIIKYPFGAGLGTVSPYNQEKPIIHLESEVYLYLIQLGDIGFFLKALFYYFVIKKLLLVNTRKANWLLFILSIFLIGNMVLALNNAIFISNFIWIMLGIEFSKPEYKKLPLNKKDYGLKKYMFKFRK